MLADPQTYSGPIAEAVKNHRNHANLGAIGPDMIFWADWSEYTPIVNALFDIYKTLDEVYEKLSAIWKPIGDVIDKHVDALSGGLAGEITETLELVRGIIQSALIKLITDKIDLLSFLKPEMQKRGAAAPIEDWNWLDYTHHRWTGQFSKALIKNAHKSNDPSLRAYSYGWLSHVTADVVGHAYVNTAVGGPYRSHWQRHFIQEKFMDSWVWGFYATPGVTMPASAVPGQIPFDYSKWTNVNGASLHKSIDLGEDMPQSLQDLLAATLSEVYENRPHPNVGGTVPFLRQGQINRAYQMMVEGLEIMTSKDRYLPKPKPPTVFNDDAFPTFPVPGGSSGSGSGGSSGGSFSLAALLQAILDYINDLFDYLQDLGLWLLSQVTYPLTFPVRYALYLLQLGLYEIYRQFRWALALSGYAYPDPDQLSNPLAQQFVNPRNPYDRLDEMPRREYPEEQDHCLFFPLSSVEKQPAMSGPYTRWPINYPYWFIEGEPSDLGVEEALMNADSPDVTRKITSGIYFPEKGQSYKGSLGSAIDFFLRRMSEVAADGGGDGKMKLPDWNLDADRGYGSKCWEIGQGTKLEPPPAGGINSNYVGD